MFLVILCGGDPVVKVVVSALDLNASDPESLSAGGVQFIVIFHPDIEEVQFILRHPVGKEGGVLIKGVLLDEAPY